MSDESVIDKECRHGARDVHGAIISLVISSRNERPRLLVSVRSFDEAVVALTGGAEILDVKDPALGSLGMASIDQISAIAQLDEVRSHAIPMSVALGELADWTLDSNFPSLPETVTFAKMGLNRVASDAKWRQHWQRIRTEFDRRSKSDLNWVAVAYADMNQAASPNVMEILDAAIDSRCVGLLIDTWTKDGRTLLDEIDASSLAMIANECHEAGLFLALAGKVSRDSLSALSRVPTDVIAIRSAACHERDRTSELESNLVREFHSEILRWFPRA